MLGDPRELLTNYSYRELRSRIDGLDEFVRARPVTLRDPDEDGVTHLRIDKPPSTKWEHDGFTYELSALTPWELDGGEAFNVATHATITTTREAGATGAEHLSAQWPVRALLLLLHGTSLAWRSHEIRDHQYPFMMMSGEEAGLAWTPIRLRRTDRDIYLPLATEQSVGLPLLHLQQLRAEGMQRWLQLYSDDAFARAVDPVVEVLNGASSFYEIRVLMTALGLDAMGYYHDPDYKHGRPIAEQIKRCVTFSGLDWSVVGSADGIGPFLARINNDLKHPDRDKRPDGLELYLADILATTLFRSQLAPLLELDHETQQGFATRKTFNDCVSAFQRNDTRLDATGQFI